MNDCIDFGIIPIVEYDRNYSCVDGPDGYAAIRKKHNCISIADDIVNIWIPHTCEISTFFCSLHNPYKGIDHYGVTLIPPESLMKLSQIIVTYTPINHCEEVKPLIDLLNTALFENKYVICYGI